MTRDETVALFLECEAKRAEARAAALAEGIKGFRVAHIAHEAAKAHWNAWASALLAERKAMEADGRWDNRESANDWCSRAQADFSFCLFLNEGAVDEEEEAKAEAALVKRAAAWNSEAISIPVDDGETNFDGFVFPDHALFDSATFTGSAQFDSATFTGLTGFESATFTGSAQFKRATFKDKTGFESTTFTGDASFDSATFADDTWFESATLNGYASFEKAAFAGDVWFKSATFTGSARFESATFTGIAQFFGQTFTHDAFFNGAKFGPEGWADFSLTTFKRIAQFNGATFESEADFNAVLGERTFSMAGARFDGVPNFIQAHFAEAPRLDNVVVQGRLFSVRNEEPKNGEELSTRERLHREWRDKSPLYRRATSGISKDSELRDIPACWRALKRLAIQGHDTDRELAFFSGEVRSARFAGDWPAPWPIWKADVWAGFLRFWAGLLYQAFSNFGRSLLRPFIAWLLCIVIFAAFYLSQTGAIQRDLGLQEVSYVSAAAQTGGYALPNTVPCYTRPATFTERWRSNWGLWGTATRALPEQAIRGLSDELRSQTNARTEALHLAFRNALIAIDSGGDASYRIYGCLYGLEGNNPIVPGTVSAASAIQKVLSGVLIFLFGLALRNMLKMK